MKSGLFINKGTACCLLLYLISGMGCALQNTASAPASEEMAVAPVETVHFSGVYH